MSFPKITIVTPSYNQGQFIEQTIDSVLSQGYPSLEYIIIDGGSTDNTLSVIKKYEKHVSYWVSEKDSGQSDAIRKGLADATGEVFNWLNSDDYYLPGALQKVGAYFKDPTLNVLGARSNIVKDGRILRCSTGSDLYPNISKSIGWARIDQPETFFRKKCIDAVNSVNTGLHYVMDKELWMKYLCLYGQENVLKIDDVIVNFRIHGTSKTSNYQNKFEFETELLFKQLASEYGFGHTIQFFQDNIKDIYSASPVFKGLTKSQAYAAVQYFLLLKAFTYYAQNKYGMCKNILAEIDQTVLDPNDQDEIEKIISRMKYPVFLKELWNLISNLRS